MFYKDPVANIYESEFSSGLNASFVLSEPVSNAELPDMEEVFNVLKASAENHKNIASGDN